MTRRGCWRLGFFLLAAFCLGGVAFALVLQFQDLAPPCPLCIFQRLGVMACGLLALCAALQSPHHGRGVVWPALLSLVALAGAAVSIRHLQIQSVTAARAGLETCGPGLNYMLQMDSVPNVIAAVLTGHGDCTAIDWQFMGITLPMLALAGFVLIALCGWIVRAWSMRASS